jgi:26S proteasome regulatory subunit N7|uniref:PCI domain-containing protein n=1 Tax=Eutreptiella gymnastica TaxID=73025 RepID=A0A7S4GB25_9EUGL
MDDDNVEQVVEEVHEPVDPLLQLKQLAFDWESGLAGDRDKIKQEIIEAVKSENREPYYSHLCEKLGWAKDEKLVAEMVKANTEAMAKLEEKKKDAEDNLGETEVHDCELEMVAHLHKIGDKDACVKKIDEMLEKVKGMGKQLDMIFQKIRLGLVFADRTLVKENIDKGNEILKREGDWERRNRLKVYEGLHCIICRDFTSAAKLLLESVATFSCNELMDFKTFIFYTVFVSIPTLSRVDLKSKVVENSEVLSVMPESPDVHNLLTSIYNCKYDKFFDALVVISERVQRNVWLESHTNYYFRELRILAFKQFLASYRSVTLEKMAQQFSISPELLDEQLCCFIAANRLNCKIDKVSGQVITARFDSKNNNYQMLLKNGDLLLNKLQKLARIVGT